MRSATRMAGVRSACSTPGGHYISGNLTVLPQRPVRFSQHFEFQLRRAGQAGPYRGVAYRLPAGDIIFLSENALPIHAFQDMLLKAMAWGGILVLAIGLTGAVITGVGSIRQISGITRAIERIVTGDLAKRLPTQRGAGDLDRLVHVGERDVG